MRKFKLIREYPLSLKLGTIIEEDKYGQLTTTREEFLEIFQMCEIEKYPEFWKEIKENIFEVLECIIDNKVVKRDILGNWRSENGFVFCTTDFILQKLAKIRSIRRLSDNQAFSIGDKVNNPLLITPQPFTITEFCFDCNNEHILALGGNGGINITKIEHYKELPYKILKSCPIEGTIYSVERISDGEIFTIGDKVDFGIIQSFKIVNNKLLSEVNSDIK